MKRLFATLLGLLVSVQFSGWSLAQSQTRARALEGIVNLPVRGADWSASIGGTVLSDATGAPIAGATVTLTRADRFSRIMVEVLPSFAIPPAATNDKGHYSFSKLEAGEYDMAVRLEGYVPRQLGTPVTLASGQHIENLPVRLIKTGRMKGHIRHHSGAPAAGIRVELRSNPQGSQSVASTKSKEDGSFSLDGFPPGAYLLAAGMPLAPLTLSVTNSTGSFLAPVNIPGEGTLTLEFSLDALGQHNIRGEVHDARTGRVPPAEALSWTTRVVLPGSDRLEPIGAENGSGIEYNSRTGSFEVLTLFPGIYKISASTRDPNACGEVAVLVFGASVDRIVLPLMDCRK